MCHSNDIDAAEKMFKAHETHQIFTHGDNLFQRKKYAHVIRKDDTKCTSLSVYHIQKANTRDIKKRANE